eukprot:CAMPEP_0194033110 /NCGR_PEP_ID=MMETSP0009_2-20130614/5899_1 /TAXON_ID=210454 /ORGANISM="Grammatophora oceanica, Strain CCMP 410" /LENGTH=511 /DNA_ID=CAMNT_0038673731 /DNA_START=373 /DNA_END=1908 /DNA_ORIENTATION=+
MACWQPPVPQSAPTSMPLISSTRSMSPVSPIMDQHVQTTNIPEPHPNDVICGRGGSANKHVGNYNFRALVQANKEMYVTLTKKQKMMVARKIVETIRNQHPSGRFLQKDTKTGMWFDIGLPRSLEKTSQALREKGDKSSSSSGNKDNKNSSSSPGTPERGGARGGPAQALSPKTPPGQQKTPPLTPSTHPVTPASSVVSPIPSTYSTPRAGGSVKAPEICIPQHLESQFAPRRRHSSRLDPRIGTHPVPPPPPPSYWDPRHPGPPPSPYGSPAYGYGPPPLPHPPGDGRPYPYPPHPHAVYPPPPPPTYDYHHHHHVPPPEHRDPSHRSAYMGYGQPPYTPMHVSSSSASTPTSPAPSSPAGTHPPMPQSPPNIKNAASALPPSAQRKLQYPPLQRPPSATNVTATNDNAANNAAGNNDDSTNAPPSTAGGAQQDHQQPNVSPGRAQAWKKRRTAIQKRESDTEAVSRGIQRMELRSPSSLSQSRRRGRDTEDLSGLAALSSAALMKLEEL